MSEVPGEEKEEEFYVPKVMKTPPEKRYFRREPLKPISLPTVEKGILVSPGFRYVLINFILYHVS
jgi:hypothetical protein